jgi:hypothetical protein
MGRSRMLNATMFEALDTSCQTFVLGSGGRKGRRSASPRRRRGVGKERTSCAVWGLSAQGLRDVFHLAQSQDMRRDGDLGLKRRKDVLTSELHARCRGCPCLWPSMAPTTSSKVAGGGWVC